MTKGEMCGALGVTLKTYNGYIRGTAIPSSILERLSSLTGCSVDYLLGLDNGYAGMVPRSPSCLLATMSQPISVQ